jgi:hypothetical protein
MKSKLHLLPLLIIALSGMLLGCSKKITNDLSPLAYCIKKMPGVRTCSGIFEVITYSGYMGYTVATTDTIETFTIAAINGSTIVLKRTTKNDTLIYNLSNDIEKTITFSGSVNFSSPYIQSYELTYNYSDSSITYTNTYSESYHTGLRDLFSIELHTP